MRITDNQQLMQVSQALAKLAETPQSQPKVGAVLNALVADLLEGGLLLNLDGKLVNAEVKNPGDFKVGQQVFLKVIQSDPGQLFVEKVAGEPVGEAKPQTPDPVLETLKAMGLPDTAKNRATLDALNAFKLPISQVNVKSLGLMQSALETIVNQQPEVLATEPQLKNLLGMGLKEIAMVLQKMGSQTAMPQGASQVMTETEQTPLSTPVNPTDGLDVVMDEAVGQPTTKSLPAANSPLGAEGQRVATDGSIKQVMVQADGDNISLIAPQKLGSSDETPALEKQVRLLMDGLETLKNPKEALKTLAFLMKLDVPATPQSLYAVGQVFNRTQLKSLLNDFFAIEGMDQLPEGIKKNLEQVKDLLRQFEPEAFKSQDTIKSLTKKLIEATEQLEITAQKTVIHSQDNTWSNKAVIDTFKTPNLPFLLSEFPLMINDKLETLELYAEKRNRGKKINPEDLRIYLSLTTEKLGQVGAMIEIKMKDILITFDAMTPEVKAAIEEQAPNLEAQIEPFGYAVTVKAQVKVKPANLRDFHEQFEPISFSRFDKKV